MNRKKELIFCPGKKLLQKDFHVFISSTGSLTATPEHNLLEEKQTNCNCFYKNKITLHYFLVLV